MPAHLTHHLYAELTLARAGIRAGASSEVGNGSSELPVLGEPRSGDPALAVGSQGPDVFYHNRRTMPSGLTYAVSIHRSKYGRLVSEMAKAASADGYGPGSSLGRFVLAYASHALVDRWLHPFINFFAGWYDPQKPETESFRNTHAFYERVVDALLVKRYRGLMPSEIDFAYCFFLGDSLPEPYLSTVCAGLRNTYKKASSDPELTQKVQNAYTDSLGFYRFTNRAGAGYFAEGIARERSGEIGDKWITIVHPFRLPEGEDLANEAKEEWSHPAHPDRRENSSLYELFEAAVGDGAIILRELYDAWSSRDFDKIEGRLDNSNLSDRSEVTGMERYVASRPYDLPGLMSWLRKESLRSTAS